ncbi:MAG: hypothetical protein A2066_15555 [Bacteroidetes bacterium GWB2_41_8]|nr:MAG: hypothetical protein A2066_15555 [Bacteroidetes bacterium GWB2_41_8]
MIQNMKITDIKIGTQLKFGFAVLLFFVVVLGVISYQMNNQIHEQTETIYNHPFQVRKALGSLESDILRMRLGTRDLMLAKTDQEIHDAVQMIEVSAADALRQFDVLYNQYLGPRSDVDDAFAAFTKWKIARDENTRLAHLGEIEKVKESVASNGAVGMARDQLIEKIKVIDDFAKNKAVDLYASSAQLKDSLNSQLFLLVAAIMALSVLLNYFLLRSIRKPLDELIGATRRFHAGELNARSSYQSKNEFGALSSSYNALADNIQMNVELEEKSGNITRLMLNEDDAREFFNATLTALAAHTNSQMAAVYLLSDDKTTFEHFESIGLNDNAKQSFEALSFEGEFGNVLASGKVQHLKNIPEDTRFAFHTVSGRFIPREILTSPIISGNEVIAVISLASVNPYNPQSVQLIDYILDIFSARVEGVLAYRKIKEVSEKLEQVSSYNRSLIEASVDPLVTIGSDGRIMDVNNATESVTGYSREKLVGTDFSIYFTEPEKAKAGYQQVFREGSVRDYELAIRSKDNRVTPVLYNASVYRDESGEIIGVFAAARDITERKLAEQELLILNKELSHRSETLSVVNNELEMQKRKLSTQASELTEQNVELEMQKKQLDESNRLKTSFLSNMSHELRTPLNSVIALSGVLNRRLSGKVPEEEYSYLDVIERNGKQLLSLINDILDLSRIEAGREEIEFNRFNAGELIGEVVELISAQASQKDIGLRYSVGIDLPPLKSDYVKCRHILQNLVANAVKFTEEGEVEISAEVKGESIQITVSDTGIGIDQEYLPFIFDEFRQADGSNSRKYGGTGLGLAIAKKYAEMLGGSIQVESTRGRGSKFTLTMPLQDLSIHENVERFAARMNPEGSTLIGEGDKRDKSILLVEDTEAVIIQMKDMLESQGYNVMVARNGNEAFEQIARQVPDGMILDLTMPEVDGFEVLRKIRNKEITDHLPVIILTAKYITKDELSFLKHNSIQQVIQKGDVNKEQLLHSVARMLFPEAINTDKPETKARRIPISGKPLVLVVEDNPDNMLTIKALLDGKCDITEAEDGRTGVEQAKKHRPHLILMDIALPGMNGIEAMNEIRNDPDLEPIPIVAVSASAMKGDREDFIALGFDGYISKPIDNTFFLKTIAEYLG